LTYLVHMTYETYGTYEANQEALDQTDVENRTDLF
jgi:hypothetical protein